ncbi:hypothetical protein [Streptomyces sp. V1I1]|nr:hypothetical protein [Streptomyces sp. V1I1]MDQ0942471.1 hypothetical protein [Streptomyces sp. V1I1]
MLRGLTSRRATRSACTPTWSVLSIGVKARNAACTGIGAIILVMLVA